MVQKEEEWQLEMDKIKGENSNLKKENQVLEKLTPQLEDCKKQLAQKAVEIANLLKTVEDIKAQTRLLEQQKEDLKSNNNQVESLQTQIQSFQKQLQAQENKLTNLTSWGENAFDWLVQMVRCSQGLIHTLKDMQQDRFSGNDNNDIWLLEEARNSERDVAGKLEVAISYINQHFIPLQTAIQQTIEKLVKQIQKSVVIHGIERGSKVLFLLENQNWIAFQIDANGPQYFLNDNSLNIAKSLSGNNPHYIIVQVADFIATDDKLTSFEVFGQPVSFNDLNEN